MHSTRFDSWNDFTRQTAFRSRPAPPHLLSFPKLATKQKQKPDTDGASALTGATPLYSLSKQRLEAHAWLEETLTCAATKSSRRPHSSAIAVMYARWPQWFFRPHTAEESRKLTSSCVSCTAAWCSLYLDRTTRSMHLWILWSNGGQ